MRQLMAWLSVVALLAGCAAIPFQEAQDVSMESADSNVVAQGFKERSPERFQLLNTIVFDYGWNRIMALGYSDIDVRENKFKVICINPVGIKLFELSGDKDNTVSHFVMPEFAGKSDFTKFVGSDIRRIYFDLTPSLVAVAEKRRYKIVFKERSGQGVMQYVFAGAGYNMIEKSYYEEGEPVWRASYYEYREHQGKSYPGGIVLKNMKYGYTLTIKLKEIQN